MNMMLRVLLLTTLLPTGAHCVKTAVFVYSSLGGDALLSCTRPSSPSCSSTSWTFYKGGRYTQEVRGGQVSPDSDKSSRLSVTSTCALRLRDLRVDDAGSYVCLTHDKAVTDVYLSLLSITSVSGISDLQPGGNLVLSCVLFTYYDAGSCKSYSSAFTLRWVDEDGIELRDHSRYQLIDTRCNITLITTLQREDNNRRWRCLVSTKENSRAAFLDFRSVFLLQNPQTTQDPSVTVGCPVELPVSRIVLCVALPLMVIIVGVFTWKLDRKKVKMSTAVIELQDVN